MEGHARFITRAPLTIHLQINIERPSEGNLIAR